MQRRPLLHAPILSSAPPCIERMREKNQNRPIHFLLCWGCPRWAKVLTRLALLSSLRRTWQSGSKKMKTAFPEDWNTVAAVLWNRLLHFVCLLRLRGTSQIAYRLMLLRKLMFAFHFFYFANELFRRLVVFNARLHANSRIHSLFLRAALASDAIFTLTCIVG